MFWKLLGIDRLMVLAITLVLLLAGCSAAKPADIAPSANPDFGVVSFIDGHASILSGSASRELAIGDHVGSQDTIKTEASSQVELEFAALGRVVIQEKTTFKIETLSAGGHKLVAGNAAGVILAKVNKLTAGDSFIVKSPTAACGVRGTAFMVKVAADGTADFVVREGKVAVFPNAALDRGWLETSTGPGNILEIDHFPVVAAGERLTVNPGDPELAKLADRLEGPPASAAAAELDADLGWHKLPTESIRDSERQTLDAILDQPMPVTSLIPVSSTVPLASPATSDLPVVSSKPTDSPPIGRELLPGDPDNSLIMLVHEPDNSVPDPAAIWDMASAYSSNPVEGPATEPERTDKYMLKVDPAAKARMDAKNGDINLYVTKVRDSFIENIYNVEIDLRQTVAVEKNGLYRISFVAWAEQPARIVPVIVEDDRDLNHDDFRWTDYKPYNSLYIGTEPQRYSETFPNYIGDDPAARIKFYIGNLATVYHLREVRFEKLGNVPARQPGNLVPNGNFDYGLLGWHVWEFGATKGLISAENGIFSYTPSARGIEPWHSQLEMHQIINIQKDRYYLVDFDAQADQACHFGFVIHESNRDLNKDGDKFSAHTKYLYMPVSQKWTHFHGRLKAISSDDKADVVFDLGNASKTIRLDNIRIQAEN